MRRSGRDRFVFSLRCLSVMAASILRGFRVTCGSGINRVVLQIGLLVATYVSIRVCRFVFHAMITSFYVLDCVPYHGFYLLRLTKRYKNGSF